MLIQGGEVMQLQSVVARLTDTRTGYQNMNQVKPNQSAEGGIELQKNMQLNPTQTGDVQNYNEKGVEEKEEKLKVENIVEAINKFLESTHTSIQFKVHDKTNDYFVQVVNRDSGDVIREIPSEQMLDLRYAVEKYLGLLVDEKI